MCSRVGREGTAATGSGNIEVPVINLAEPDHKVATALWHAATSVGFFSVVGHGVQAQHFVIVLLQIVQLTYAIALPRYSRECDRRSFCG
eukprot:SAG31_NODE_2641_length_5326_cov_9.734647_5_plen_89_part_00